LYKSATCAFACASLIEGEDDEYDGSDGEYEGAAEGFAVGLD
jgi:hypothetical protein